MVLTGSRPLESSDERHLSPDTWLEGRMALAAEPRPPDAWGAPTMAVEVRWCAPLEDPEVQAIVSAAALLGITGLTGLEVRHVYYVWNATDSLRRRLVDLLANPILHDVVVGWSPDETLASTAARWMVETVYHPGVLDPAGDGATARLRRLLPGTWRLRTGCRYLIASDLAEEAVRRLAGDLLYNPLVQTMTLCRPPDHLSWEALFQSAPAPSGAWSTVEIAHLDDTGLLALSADRHLALDLDEMRAVQAYFAGAGRPPTDVELETFALAWSEHCSHKTFKAIIDYTEEDAAGQVTHRTIDGLLREMLMAPARRLARPWVRSAFADNAGVIAFGPHHEVAIKVETHNHPSALEPFGGAQTGVGGVIRDVLGVSSQPIAATDVLCFGLLDTPAEDVPPGTLHPLRVFRGVVAGVGDYANKVGVPTVNGAVVFDPGYAANPLVFCGCVGIAPRGLPRGRPAEGDLVVVVGGRTGRDGLHGATFSSDTMDGTTSTRLSSAVQIGEPIVEKGLIDTLTRAAAANLYRAITDCGAGGLCSAVGELADPGGVEIDLARAPLKYAGLAAWEIWLSESQERMVLAVPPGDYDALAQLCRNEEVEMAVMGRFTDDGRLCLRFDGQIVADLPLAAIYQGSPPRRMTARWSARTTAANRPDVAPAHIDHAEMLLRVLAHPNVCSREAVVTSYDQEVQAATVGKPLLGLPVQGPADGAVLRPLADSWRGLAIACGIAPRAGRLDPYQMALHAIDEALRNLTAVGGDPARAGLLDNFCWGDPRQPETLGRLVRAAQGCRDAALALRTPFISGKDSLYNEYATADGRRLSIPDTLLITAVAPMADIRRMVTSDLKAADNLLYVVGETGPEVGGSLLSLLDPGAVGDGALQLPPVDLALSRRVFRAVARAMRRGLVRACHDCSEGGIAVALAEMAIAGGLGATVDLGPVCRRGNATPGSPGWTEAALLFGESPTRFVVEVSAADAAAFEAVLIGLPLARIGRVIADPLLQVNHGAARTLIALSLTVMAAAWKTPLEPQPAARERWSGAGKVRWGHGE